MMLTLAALFMSAGIAVGQTVRTIAVSNDKSYTDHVSLAQDSRDMDVMIKFVFDEPNNVLTVSLLSYRRLFVFRESSRYNNVVRCGRIRPERLPYIAEADEGTRFPLSRQLKRSIPAPKCKYIFSRWIEYEGLQPTPSECKMVNDFIEQSFEIQGKRTSVNVTLGDVYLLDSKKEDSGIYELAVGRDLNLKYRITIVRNPCLDMDDAIAAARSALLDVQKAYNGFRANFADGAVTTEDALNAFRQTKAVLLTQFPRKDAQASCPNLEAMLQQYNQYVDSIGMLSCSLVIPEDVSWDDGKPLDTELLYTQTRQLDKAMARWLVSKDNLEKKDLITQCQDIIKDVSAMIRQHRISTPEERQAVQAYRQAEAYFHKICKQ